MVRKEPWEDFPRSIRCLTEAPAALQPGLAACLDDDPSDRTMVLAPSHQSGLDWLLRRSGRAQVLIVTDRQIIMAFGDRRGGAATVHACPLENLLYLEYGHVLLQGWVTMVVATNQGVEQHTVAFNTVREELFRAPVQRLQRTLGRISPAEHWPVPEETLRVLSCKFMNRTLRYKLPEERLRLLIQQPETWKPHLHFFRRQRSPEALCLLTDHYLLLLLDQPGDLHYGGCVRYLALDRIKGIDVQAGETGPLATFHLAVPAGAVSLELPVDSATVSEMQRLANLVREVTEEAATRLATAAGA